MDKEITQFKIYKAEAERENNTLVVRLYYPRNPQQIERRIDENLSWGEKTLTQLIQEGYAEIANAENPIKPCTGGSLYVFNDGNIVVHRRDYKAPIHALYHAAPGGYSNSVDFLYTERGLIDIALRETAEECLLVTRDNPPWLIVPKDAKEYTLESAKRLGLELRPRYVSAETLNPSDKLEVYYEDGEHIFTAKAFLDLQWEGSTSLDALQLRKLPISVEDVLPIDAEGMINEEGRFVHFNRESYFLSMAEVSGKNFGDVLKNPRVFKTQIEKGIPRIFTPEYKEPFFGPDKHKVKHPHVFAPENHLVTLLDALNVPGFKGRKNKIELWKIQTKLKGRNLIPQEMREHINF